LVLEAPIGGCLFASMLGVGVCPLFDAGG
jgi:hypothetical protein